MSTKISKYQLMSDEEKRKKIEYQKNYNKKKDTKEYNRKYYQDNKYRKQITKELCICGATVINMKGHLTTNLHNSRLNIITCILISMKDANV